MACFCKIFLIVSAICWPCFFIMPSHFFFKNFTFLHSLPITWIIFFGSAFLSIFFKTPLRTPWQSWHVIALKSNRNNLRLSFSSWKTRDLPSTSSSSDVSSNIGPSTSSTGLPNDAEKKTYWVFPRIWFDCFNYLPKKSVENIRTHVSFILNGFFEVKLNWKAIDDCMSSIQTIFPFYTDICDWILNYQWETELRNFPLRYYSLHYKLDIRKISLSCPLRNFDRSDYK